MFLTYSKDLCEPQITLNYDNHSVSFTNIEEQCKNMLIRALISATLLCFAGYSDDF
jgi:hypothetical protein